MPVYLKLRGDVIVAKLSGYDSRSEFNDDLQRVKGAIEHGRRWNPDEKQWEFQATADNARKLLLQAGAVPDAGTQALISNAEAETTEALITDIGDDGDVRHPVLRDILYPYQRAFVAWAQDHPHALLCDEMGIGKTLQAIATVLEADYRAPTDRPGEAWASRGPVLCVVPNGLRRRWRREILHGPTDRDGKQIYPSWPELDCVILDGSNPGKRRKQLTEPADFYVTNWEKLRSDTFLWEDRGWRAVIADEAHRAKNRTAQQTEPLVGEYNKGQAHKAPKLTAPIQLALTGTPMMNTPDELWALLRWNFPDQYKSFWEFHYAYVDEIQTKKGRVMVGAKNTDDLRFELGDRMVRRTKRQVLPDLPAKLPPEVVEVELNKSEAKLYAEAEDALILDVAQHAVARAREEAGEKVWSEKELEARAHEIVEELADLPLKRLEGVIDNGASRIQALRQITAQAKAREAVEIIRDNPGKPFVTFTWYVPPAQWIAEQLQKQGPLGVAQRVTLIAGSGGDAEELAQEFQRGDTDQAVCTIAKGGTGLDLYRASTAIFADEDWVPDVNNQALDRLHRKGQINEVSSIILRVPNTVDTGKVAPALRFKDAIYEAVFGAR